MITLRPAGDAALLLEIAADVCDDQLAGNAAARLAAAIRAAALPGVVDVVPGAATVLVSHEPGSSGAAGLAVRLRALVSAPLPPPVLPAASTAELVLDTVYDGPDLAEVARLTGLSTAGVIARHAAARYLVGWLGFSPGFGYLTGLDPALAAVPRRASPRVSVPAGSVAIAGGLAAAYPAASPGGWCLLGRTDAALWDPGRDPPALLSPGQHVRFRPVDRLRASAAPAIRPPESRGAGPIEVLQPGPLTTIQDLGRPGLAHLGVPGSGAADAVSLRLANRLVGSPASAAGLEVTLGRLALRFDSGAVVAVTGAPVPMTLERPRERVPASDRGGERRHLRQRPGRLSRVLGGPIRAPDPRHGTAFAVPAGSVLRLGSPAVGLRSYLAVAGGIDVAPVLGSRSADRLSGLGPPPLRPGDRLPVGRARSPVQKPPDDRPGTGGPAAGADPVPIRVIAGPRDDWFARDALTSLAAGSYQVTPASDRTGLRLAGPPLARSPGRPGELPSEGVAAGSLQVTHEGQPILLLADHPTTGGYPVIAVVKVADLGLAAQLRPGQRVRFAVSRTVLD
ncbi:MAG: carboxyltransferase domain-containing protein [Streptosporangiaceae bacterium]